MKANDASGNTQNKLRRLKEKSLDAYKSVVDKKKMQRRCCFELSWRHLKKIREEVENINKK